MLARRVDSLLTKPLHHKKSDREVAFSKGVFSLISAMTRPFVVAG